MKIRITLIAAAIGAAALALTACGPTYHSPAPVHHSVHHQKPKSAYVADSHGMTLYTFSTDRPGRSSCMGQCLVAWPLAEQVTSSGMPTYTYAGDSSPGDASGDGISSYGGTWYAIHAGT